MTISSNFTIEDIHKIRYENYENTKKLSHQELIEKTRKDAEEGMKILGALKMKNKPN
jgi:hypothetical protein